MSLVHCLQYIAWTASLIAKKSGQKKQLSASKTTNTTTNYPTCPNKLATAYTTILTKEPYIKEFLPYKNTNVFVFNLFIPLSIISESEIDQQKNIEIMCQKIQAFNSHFKIFNISFKIFWQIYGIKCFLTGLKSRQFG